MALQCIKKTELAYLAGFIDGDGTISINSGGGGYMRPIVSVANSDRTVIDFVAYHWRGNVYSQKGWGENSKQIHWVRVVNKYAIELIRDLLPFLDQKLKQGKVVLKWSETVKDKKDRNNNFIKKIRLLNKRGVI